MWAGGAQVVQQLNWGCTIRGPNPGRGEIFQHSLHVLLTSIVGDFCT